MTDDLVKRLRVCAAFDPDQAEAADCIEKFRAANLQQSLITVDHLARIEKLEAALRSIAANACCDGCREAALVARRALIEKEYETGERIREANDD